MTLLTLTRDQIEGSRHKRRYTYVPTPEILPDSSVRIQSLLASERTDYEKILITVRGKTQVVNQDEAKIYLVALSLVDEDGVRLFDIKDRYVLNDIDGAALTRIASAALTLSGIDEEAVPRAKADLIADEKKDFITD